MSFMRITVIIASLLATGLTFAAEIPRSTPAPATGPLKVLQGNPRYFTDGSGKAILLTGSHTWDNFQDNSTDDPPVAFGYEEYLDWMAGYNHNYMRMWVWEQAAFSPWAPDKDKEYFYPMPYERTGPGLAGDGKPKFDLTKFNQAYFDRLRQRVKEAGDRGIYVSVMLFQGWSRRLGSEPLDPWPGHPLNIDNNINGINGDTNRDSCPDLVGNPEVRAVHAAYAKKVVDTVNDLDNVLYEVINEGGHPEWNQFIVDTVHEYEKTKPKQHPIGITGHGPVTTEQILASTSDWISPGFNCDPTLKESPHDWNEDRPSLLDTDHIWGIGGDNTWIWKAFLRGHNPVFMDPYTKYSPGQKEVDPAYDTARKAMGVIRRCANAMDLAHMTPQDALASTTYCLANPGVEYLVYEPGSKDPVAVNLRGFNGRFAAEWIHPITGETVDERPIRGGNVRELNPPFKDGAVLHMKLQK